MFNSISVGGKGNDALVVAHFVDADSKPLGFDKATLRKLASHGLAEQGAQALTLPEATGESGALAEVPGNKQYKRLIVVGLGKAAGFDAGSLRTVAGNLGRRLAAVKAGAVTVEVAAALKDAGVSPKAAGLGVGEGLGLLGWVCDQFRGSATPAPKRTDLSLTSDDARFLEGVQRGLALAVSTNYTRTLSQTPPNIATPEFMSKEAKKLADKVGLKYKEFAGDALKKEKLIGHIEVGKASENKPRMIRLEYTPKKAPKNAKPVVLIGKTMCYDTGGLSLKINNGMVGMKRDKDGGCAVLGAMHAIATVIKPDVPVVALLAAAENSISDEAYRPDDVITYRNGVTVEVTNTDAEGRLVLADCLVWACQVEKPRYIVDLATLTGGVVVALGSTYCGMFCEDDRLREKIEKAAAAGGERVWRLPMHAEYRDMMKSPVADILNSNPNRKAHPIQGAAFLSYFVEENMPWCHLDIAGVHVSEKNAGCWIDGPTGWGVRTLANLVEAER
jgi:leucyl aminopeptidase